VLLLPRRLLLGKLLGDSELINLWLKIEELERSILEVLCSLYIDNGVVPKISVRAYRYGDLIINEGDKPDGVYVLIDGEAHVTVDGVKMGTIRAGEIFGEISFLTGNNRTATVVAKTNCIVQFIDSKNFALLIKYKPKFFLNISKNLAQRVVELNKRIVKPTK
jgi:CRP-like cAMP-binding protein